MMKIVLMCGGGFSTSLLVQRMQDHAKTLDQQFDISAVAISTNKELVEDAQILLLGPQVGFRKKEIETKYPSVVVEVIPSIDYGMMDGKKVLEFAIEKAK